MDGAPPHVYVTADRGSIAAAGNITIDTLHQHVRCSLRPCPSCEIRLLDRNRRICRFCARKARLARIQRDGMLALLGYGVCVAIGLWLADRIGYSDRWTFGIAAAVLIFGGGYYLWLKVLVWAECDAKRQLRACLGALRHPRRWRLTRWLRRVSMFLRLRAAPSRRAPGSDEDTYMEPKPVDAERTAQMHLEVARMTLETARIQMRLIWSPVTGAIIFAAGIAAVKFLL